MTTKVSKIWMAVQHVKRARDLLREAGCKPSADTMAKALKSAEGAHRHAKIHADAAAAVREALDSPPVFPAFFAPFFALPADLPEPVRVIDDSYIEPRPCYYFLRGADGEKIYMDEIAAEAREHYERVKQNQFFSVILTHAQKIKQALAAI